MPAKKARPATFTLIEAGYQQVTGPNGDPYIVPLFHLRNKDGELAIVKTEKGDIPLTIAAAPINVARAPGLFTPGNALRVEGLDSVRR